MRFNRLTIIMLLHTSLLFTAFGQSFTYHSDSPFGIQTIKADSSRAAQNIMFADYDRDGDLDLFLTGIDVVEDFENWEGIHYFIEMQENIGDKWNPQFGERVDMSEDFPFPLGYFFPSAGDVNDDGNTDFIVSANVSFIGNRTAAYLRNSGTPGPNQFETIRFDEMGLPDFVPESFFVPDLVDLDSDGDLDILMSGFDPAFGEEDGADIPQYYYARNVGTKTDPDFEGWHSNPYGLIPSPVAELLTSGDIDNDGDIDLLGAGAVIPADSMNYLYVHLNTPGFNPKPLFIDVLQSPYGLPSTFGEELLIFPDLVDIDGDGDLDLFVFKGNADTRVFSYYENSLCSGVINNMSVILCEGDAILVGGVPYSGAGNYTITLPGSDGCDSTILLTISLIPSYVTFLDEFICEGQVLVVGDEMFSEAGDYMVSLDASNGCDSLVVLTLFVLSGPITSFQATICQGEVYLFGDEELSVAGQYQMTLTTNEGCDSIVMLNLSVIELSNAVILFENVLIADQFAMSYQWLDCDSGQNIPGATNQSYEVPVNGNYAVSITDDTGCTTVSECINVIISGTQDITISNAITLYPNPTDGLINVLNATSYEIPTVTLMNLAGQTIGEFRMSSKHQIDLSFLEQGVYLAMMNVNGQVVVKKVIVF